MQNQNTPDPATEKVLASLDAMSAIWASKNNIRRLAESVANVPDSVRVTYILNAIKQGFVEGAYQCFCDAQDGKVQGLIATDSK